MGVGSHIHTDDIIVDADVHFTIDTATRAISNQNGDKVNKKLTLMQYDNKSERYSFDVDRIIDGHDLMDCNRIQIHFINIGSNKQKNIGLYLVDDVQVSESDNNKITFTWLISQNATMLNGILKFLISFECINGEDILYRWSSATYDAILITAGMDNSNAMLELYSDELLAWQHEMETKYLPNLVDERYVDREFATSEEVMRIFNIQEAVELEGLSIDSTPTENSTNLVESGGVKNYVDNTVESINTALSNKPNSKDEYTMSNNDKYSTEFQLAYLGYQLKHDLKDSTGATKYISSIVTFGNQIIIEILDKETDTTTDISMASDGIGVMYSKATSEDNVTTTGLYITEDGITIEGDIIPTEGVKIKFPSASGTLALSSDVDAKVTELTNQINAINAQLETMSGV